MNEVQSPVDSKLALLASGGQAFKPTDQNSAL